MTAAARAALTGLALAVVAATPAQAAPPKVGAKSAIVVDAATGEQLYARSPDTERSIASTTKLMTALLTLERAKPRDVFTAPAYGGSAVESMIGLRKGERMTVGDLTRALMLASANDAAATLAEEISGSRTEFVEDMNSRARQLGLTETSYANPIGLDDPDNYSSASDLAALARRLLLNERFARIVDLPSATLKSGSRRRSILNRNLLVRRHPFVDGVKTGHTARRGLRARRVRLARRRAGDLAWCSASRARARATATRSRCFAGGSTSTAASRRCGRARCWRARRSSTRATTRSRSSSPRAGALTVRRGRRVTHPDRGAARGRGPARRRGAASAR